MKKLLSLILVVVLIVCCCSCGKKDAPETNTTAPVETEDATQKTESQFYSKVITSESKYAILSVDNYPGFDNEDAFLWARRSASKAEDWATFSNLQATKGKTIVAFPLEADWSYNLYASNKQMKIWQKEEMIADIIVMYGDVESIIAVEDFIYLTEVVYPEHTGALYSYRHEGEKTNIYMGETPSGTTILVRTPNSSQLREILDKLVVRETNTAEEEPTMAECTVIDDVYNGISLMAQKDSAWNFITENSLIVATNDAGQKFTIESISSEDCINTIRDMMDKFRMKQLVCVDSTYCFGYIFTNEDVTGYVGMDKDTGNGVVITGTATQEQLFKVLKNVNIAHKETTAATVNETNVYKDIDIINELAYITELTLSDPEIYKEYESYVKDNYSCYASSAEADADVQASVRINTGYTVNDSWRTEPGVYVPVGTMKGLTITFNPTLNENGVYVYSLGDAVVNQFIEGTDTLQTIGEAKLFNSLQNMFWDNFEVYADSHQNLPITIFVSSNEARNLQVYAQFGGLNP